MRTIMAADRRMCFLSDETYTITSNGPKGRPFPSLYQKGTVVRLISGIRDNTIPGYHFDEKYFTVCREGVVTAEFVGIERKYLKENIKGEKNAIRLTEMNNGYDGRPTRLEVLDFSPGIHDKAGVYLQHVEGCGYEVYELTPQQALDLADILIKQARKSQNAFSKAGKPNLP